MESALLHKKLLLKSGQRAIVLNAPANYLDNLLPLPEGIDLAARSQGKFDFVQLFVKNLEELRRHLPEALGAVKYDALLWIAYPKGGLKAGTDLNRDILRQAIAEHDLEAVTLVALDDTWSSMRFRPVEKVGS